MRINRKTVDSYMKIDYVLENQRWTIDSCLRINEERSDELILKSTNQWMKSRFSYIIYFIIGQYIYWLCNSSQSFSSSDSCMRINWKTVDSYMKIDYLMKKLEVIKRLEIETKYWLCNPQSPLITVLNTFIQWTAPWRENHLNVNR